LILQDFLALEMRRYSSTAIPDSNLSDTPHQIASASIENDRQIFRTRYAPAEMDEICH
jgi:hypothetical protein